MKAIFLYDGTDLTIEFQYGNGDRVTASIPCDQETANRMMRRIVKEKNLELFCILHDELPQLHIAQ